MSDAEISPSYRLKDLVSSQTVRAKVAVRDWEEATNIAGTLLTQSGVALPDYIDAMKRVLIEMGPYAVIAPGIVLLHARPEDGVLRPGIALVTLSTPVNFGHSENDPVDLVFALAATDKTSHLQGLRELAQLLSDEEMVKEIRTAQTDEELLRIVHSV
ncbi:MAG: PTS sugar transporter subunit IIA [Thermanaerothrix sp.]|uniref:PTS sugar transporter subunit IIA n=1 Tax=Thermanaerothrix sp. TaxID=2972675 RepID=UPI003C7E1297